MLYPSRKASERVQQARADFRASVADLAAKNLVFIDEAGVNLAMVRLMARSEKGKRARGSKPSRRGQNVSMMAALGFKQVLGKVNLLGSSDALTFEAFMVQRVIPKLWKGACVILDNCSIHCREKLEPLVEAVGARLIFLPPYSPEFSPIENCWSKVKSILRSIETPDYAALERAIEEAFAQVSEQDIKGWFTKACYCTSLD